MKIRKLNSDILIVMAEKRKKLWLEIARANKEGDVLTSKRIQKEFKRLDEAMDVVEELVREQVEE